MKYSQTCLKLIKKTRKLYLEKTKLWNNYNYIGYSHICTKEVSSLEVISKKEASSLLIKDLEKISKNLNKHLLVDLNQNQFDSLVSLIYDIGIKRLITDEMFELINKGKLTEASLCFNKFNRYKKQPIYRLIKTRKEEQKLWLMPIEDINE